MQPVWYSGYVFSLKVKSECKVKGLRECIIWSDEHVNWVKWQLSACRLMWMCRCLLCYIFRTEWPVLCFFLFFCSSEGWLPSDTQRCGGGSRGAGRHGVHPTQRSPRTDHLLETKQHPGHGPRWQDHCEYASLLSTLQWGEESFPLINVDQVTLKKIWSSAAGGAQK